MNELVLFCQFSDPTQTKPSLPEGVEYEYFGAIASLRVAPPGLKKAVLRWWVYCLFKGHPFSPTVFILRQAETIVHYSVILPRLGRIPAMRRDDVEIGPCWTHPAFRGRKLFQLALQMIRRDLCDKRRAFWMICRDDNFPSKAAITKAGFTPLASCDRRSLMLSLTHRYVNYRPLLSSLITPSDWRDTQEERLRYNTAASELREIQPTFGAPSVPEALREPYEHYHAAIKDKLRSQKRTLDVCCGSGSQTLPICLRTQRVFGVDIAQNSLRAARDRAAKLGSRLHAVSSVATLLPFADCSFDLVTCAGGLSYMRTTDFIEEVVRVLTPDGTAIFVDSFDENPIYRLNRRLHVWLGSRSRNTLDRIPNMGTIGLLNNHFSTVNIRFFGVLTFVSPVLTPLIGAARTAAFLRWTDSKLTSLQHLAFKVVIVATNPRHKI